MLWAFTYNCDCIKSFRREIVLHNDDNENQYVLKLAFQTVTADAEREYNLYIIKNKIEYIICKYNSEPHANIHRHKYTNIYFSTNTDTNRIDYDK